MAVRHQGNAKWLVERTTDGSIAWSLRAEQDGKPVVIRGKSRSPAEARTDIGTALVELIALRKHPLRG